MAVDVRPELIVALDVASLEDAEALIALLRPSVRWFKVGLELFTAAGPAAVEAVHRAGGRVFLDLKLHDIPHTVSGAVRRAARMGVNMLTLHLAGGPRMAEAAVEAARGYAGAPLLLGVFRLTSDPAESSRVWTETVPDASRRAAAVGLDGLVAAVGEVPLVRAAVPAGFLTVSPGIRPSGAPAGDQARTATPAEAARAATDFIVVGRPILASPDPLAAAQQIIAEMRGALAATPA